MYSTAQCLKMARVSAKSLRHYERLGLVQPARTSAGHRRYSLLEVTRIHQLLALKCFGFSLRAIKTLLAGRRLDLAAHVGVLERERSRLTLAIDTLRHLPAAIEAGAAQRRLLGEALWEWSEARYREAGTTIPMAPARVCESRLAAFQELARLLELDPASERTRAAAVAFRSATDPEALRALQSRAEWPTGMRRYIASLYDATPDAWERVMNFLGTLPPPQRVA
jgi:DNA-binding transcriptional MerR regulator